MRTRDKNEAKRLFAVRNEAHQQPAINLQIARAYLSATDPQIGSRTWQQVMDEAGRLKQGPTQERWHRAMSDRAFDSIRQLTLLETRPEHFMRVLEEGTVCTNIFLRRLHNFAIEMDWLPKSVIPRWQWPKIEFKSKRGITCDEHQSEVTSMAETLRISSRLKVKCRRKIG